MLRGSRLDAEGRPAAPVLVCARAGRTVLQGPPWRVAERNSSFSRVLLGACGRPSRDWAQPMLESDSNGGGVVFSKKGSMRIVGRLSERSARVAGLSLLTAGLVLSLTATVAAAPKAGGGTLYVSPSGSDSRSCTKQAPCLTIC